MKTLNILATAALTAAIVLPAFAAQSATPQEILKKLETAASAQSPGFKGLSAERGQRFFQSTHGNDWSCASCHTDKPTAQGKHAKTGKPIAALAPAANPERFTNEAKVEKWFGRNCKDVLGRVCSAQEQGDVLAYLLSLTK